MPALPIDDAAALFTQRARQLEPRFEPDPASPSDRRAPRRAAALAVELAAARVKVLTPEQILERLGRSLDLLTSVATTHPSASARCAGRWSGATGSSATTQQRLFAQVAVFSGGFQLEAAEALCSADLDVLQSLVDKSLLRHGEDGRFFMLATIRELALERLAQLPDGSALRRLTRRLLPPRRGRARRARSWPLRHARVERRGQLATASGAEPPNFRAAVAGLLEDDRRGGGAPPRRCPVEELPAEQSPVPGCRGLARAVRRRWATRPCR